MASDGIIVREVLLRDLKLPEEYAQGLEGLLLKEQESERMEIETEISAKHVRIAELQAEAAKAITYNALRLFHEGQDCIQEVTMAKLMTQRGLVEIAEFDPIAAYVRSQTAAAGAANASDSARANRRIISARAPAPRSRRPPARG